MDILSSINIITAAIICIFAIPILVGIIRPLSSGRIYRSVSSLMSSLIFLASVILAVYLTRVILSGSENFVLTALYKVFPALEAAVASRQIWVYILFIAVLFIAVTAVLHLLAWPVYRYAIPPLSNGIYSAVSSMNAFFRRVIGGLWQVPKALSLVLVFSILLTFYTGFFNSSFVTEAAEHSAPYQFVQGRVIQPLLGSSVVKDIQIILNDSFRKAKTENAEGTDRFGLIRYFNGVTLGEAVRSNAGIDDTAKQIVGEETDDKRKAYLIYLWICENLTYDNSKAAAITKNPADVSSGAAVAFSTRKGVCFDFSCLYVAMCRAVGLKVRFIVGLGFSGDVWGDHAWNQAYYPKEDRWIDVDTTFGSSGINYFDRPYFYLDHKDGIIEGEW